MMTSNIEIQEQWRDIHEADEKHDFFMKLNIHQKVDLINWLAPAEQEQLLKMLPLERIKTLLAAIPPDDLVDIMQVAAPEVRSALWSTISPEAQQELKFLLRFDAEDAAGIMTSRYLAIHADFTVRQAITFVRQAGRTVETVYYIYVVDTVKRLSGIVSLRDLLSTDDSKKVSDIMTSEVIRVSDEDDREIAARLLDQHKLIAIPVVDHFKRLLGIITFDDVIDVIRSEHTEDTYRMHAMGGNTDSYMQTSIFKLVRKRIPWLVLLLLAGTITSNIIDHFSPLLLSATFLILFVPVITQAGGNSSVQSSTLMIRGLAMHEIGFRDIGKVMVREIAIGLILGVILGGVLLLRSIFLPPGVTLVQAFSISASLTAVVLFSSMIGAFAPLVIDKCGLDPTVMAGPLMSTIIDIIGITIYLGITGFILKG